MKIELKETISDETKIEYIDFCRNVQNQIIDAYKTFFYLKAVEEKHLIKREMPWSEQAYVEFLIRCFQERLVLSVNKLAIDSGSEKYCVKNLRSFIKRELASSFDEHGLVLSINSNKKMEEQIKDYRDKFIAHNLRGSREISLYMSQMKSLLDEVKVYYNKLLLDELLPGKMVVTDIDISGLERFCKMGLRI